MDIGITIGLIVAGVVLYALGAFIHVKTPDTATDYQNAASLMGYMGMLSSLLGTLFLFLHG